MDVNNNVPMDDCEALIAPIPCESPFHEGQKVAAQRLVGLKCPDCGAHWDPLMCSVCYGRLGKRALRCKCGSLYSGIKWLVFDVPIQGPMTAQA